MAITTDILPNDLETPIDREPLQPRSRSPNLSMTKRIRRKHSFVLQPDSSEEYSSPHDSIYEAVYISATNSDSSNNRIELIDIPPRRSGPTQKAIQNDENKKTPDAAAISMIDQIEFRYGWGTPLETITEKRSFATIRSIGCTKSADDLPDVTLLEHRDSFTLARDPRRKASFSLDDLILVQKSYHEACATIARQTFRFPIDEVYAEPKSPVRAPPERRPTPDGMPSWTASQNIPLRPVPTPPVPNAFQRFFGLPASGINFSSRIPQLAANPNNRSASGPGRSRIAPRFRPPRSAYGQIEQHPFANAPMAQVKTEPRADVTQALSTGRPSAIARPAIAKTRRKLQRVRFTPSATARDSEMLNFQAAVETTISAAIHPLATPPMSTQAPVGIEPAGGSCPHRRYKVQNSTPVITGEHIAALEPVDLILPVVEDRRDATSNNSLDVPSISRTSDRASSRTASSSFSLVTDDPDLRSRATSQSSTAWLMSGALRSPSGSTTNVQQCITTQVHMSKTRDPFCWRCACGRAGKKIRHWWRSSADCLCFVCCGFDLEENVTAAQNGASTEYPRYRHYRHGSSGQDFLAARSINMPQHPRWTV